MLSTIKYITHDINNQPWDLGENCGLEFENFLYDTICHVLTPLFSKGLRVFETPNTRDDGKDIIIESPVPLHLFGINFSLKEKENIKLHIECKSSNGHKIDLDKFSKNLLIANHDDIDYLILITNMTISPFSFFQAIQNAIDYQYEFVLVDQYLLHSFFKEYHLGFGKYIPPSKVEELSVSYQICKGRLEGRPCFDLFLFFRNNKSSPSLAKFRLKTDRNWKMSNSEFEIFLDAHKSECKKIIVEKEYFDGLDDIILEFTLNQEHKLVELNGTSLNYHFETPLVGEGHKEIIRNINSEIYDNTHFKLFHLHGNAGIGKTRIIDELCKESANCGIHIFYYRCIKRQNIKTTESFLKELEKVEGFFNKSSIKQTLQCISCIMRKYLIIIEDIHNATEEFFDEIEELKTLNTNIPTTLIISGRDDYTVYNERYFTFLDTIVYESKPGFLDIEVKKLTDAECNMFIKMMIEDVPNTIIQKIQVASENIPFYIVQFIEYLLEIDLLYLVNRNTVGITNITTFNQKIYIPKKVETIINKRFMNLGVLTIGKKLQSFLLLLAYYEQEFPKSLLTELFEDDELEQLENLFVKHFLKFSPKNNIMFDHENIYLFLKKYLTNSTELKKICQTIYKRNLIFKELDIFKKGRIFYNIKDYKNAAICYKEPIEEIEHIKNISSENLNPYYFDYLEDIYFIHKIQKNLEMQKKTIIATIYIAIHNQENGKVVSTFHQVWTWIENYHNSDEELIIVFKQLEAHYYMQNGMLTKALKSMNELIAKERIEPKYFNDEVRFNLFDRFSSMSLQFNHKEPAFLYNDLSQQLANRLNDKKLQTLSYISAAKINFYEKPEYAYKSMLKARKILSIEKVERINLHNELSILTTKLLLKKTPSKEMFKTARSLLEDAIRIKYPMAEIRAHFLLAVLYLMDNSLHHSNKHIETSIKMSIRYGNAKLMAPIYNLKAMIAYNEKQSIELIYKYYTTMLLYLKQQNLLFLGALDFGYGNIINLTNYAKFLIEYGLESEIYQLMGCITYYGSETLCDFTCETNKHCYYSCQKNLDIFKENLNNINNNGLIFLDKKYHYDLIDNKSGFLIPIGV